MDTCPDCLRPLFQDLIHRCRRTNEASPSAEQPHSRSTLPADGSTVKPDEKH